MEIFISYASQDQGLSERLEEKFKAEGILVHRDRSSVRIGDEWKEKVFPRIERCDAFILLWSKDAAKSIHVHEEILHAVSYKRQIAPLMLDETRLIPLLEDKQHFKLNDLDLQFSDLLSEFNIEFENINRPVAENIRDAIKTYQAVVNDNFSQFQILFEGREKEIGSAYVELNLLPGLGGDNPEAGISPERLLGKLISDDGDVVLTGHPGAGKSSTLHYLMYKWSLSSARNIAIFARLKDFEQRFYSNLEDFLKDKLFGLIGRPGPQSAFNEVDLFSEIDTILFLDGLDEIPAGNYEAFLGQLNEFREGHRKSKIIVTTRIDGFKNIREEDFRNWKKYIIAKLDDHRIRQFLHQWFEDPKKEEEVYERLQAPRLQELARRAFLLALICLVYNQKEELGRNRSELYSQATTYLENSRDPSSLTLERRKKVLKEVALKFLQLNTIELQEKIVHAFVSEVLDDNNIEPRKFLNDLVSDTGLMQHLGGSYIFTHKSFQEYYAALALSEISSGEELLIDYSEVLFWEEPIRLYAGALSSQNQQQDFIKELWIENPALALRTATECHNLATRFLSELIKDSPPENRLRMINEVRYSLSSFDRETARRLTIETLSPLLEHEEDSAVLYYGVELLKEFDPNDSGNLMYETFYKDAEILFSELTTDPKYKFEFIDIDGGSFIMGDDNAQDKIEKPAHKVTLDSFKIAKYQLTNLAFERIMGNHSSRRDADISIDDDQPVVNLNWFDAYVCALKVGCRLPAEAEWEYAARAGSNSDWCFGDDSDELYKYANYEESGVRATWKVGSGLANDWGLFDVHGNVWEWCQDWLAPYTKGHKRNPVGPEKGTARVRRGGGHAYHARGCRSAFRWGNDPTYKFKDIGVRFAK